jgi:hypothetical protein
MITLQRDKHLTISTLSDISGATGINNISAVKR